MLLKWIICVAVFIFFPARVDSKDALRVRNSDDFIPCEKGWYNFREKCYKVAGKKKSGRMPWDRAVTRCVNDGGNLVSIHSKEEFDFIVSFLLMDVKANVWIGLHDKVNESDYTWNDGSAVNYTNWKDMEPSGLANPDEDCVQMLFDPERDIVGKWNDISCGHELPFICQMSINQKKKSPNPAYCASDVGGGWKFQNSCYYIVSDKKSWENAEQYCVDNLNGHLVTVSDKLVDLFLDQLYPDKHIWIGIKIKAQLQQKWTSGWHVSYNGINKEHGDFIEGTCVVRRNTKMWTMHPCDKVLPFVCEISQVRPPVLKLPMKGSHCPTEPNDWRDLDGDSCYYFETKTARSWYEANFDCMRRGGHLLSLHSEEESQILHPFVRYEQYMSVHIGLFRLLANVDDFVWADGTGKPDYENWSHDEPNNDQEMCVEIWTRDFTWNDKSCDDKNGYICSVKKITQNITIIEKSNECSGHISFKALIGVSICIILVIILLGVVVYYFRRWDGERRKNSTQMPCPTPSPINRLRYRSTTELTLKEEENNYEMMR